MYFACDLHNNCIWFACVPAEDPSALHNFKSLLGNSQKSITWALQSPVSFISGLSQTLTLGLHATHPRSWRGHTSAQPEGALPTLATSDVCT